MVFIIYFRKQQCINFSTTSSKNLPFHKYSISRPSAPQVSSYEQINVIFLLSNRFSSSFLYPRFSVSEPRRKNIQYLRYWTGYLLLNIFWSALCSRRLPGLVPNSGWLLTTLWCFTCEKVWHSSGHILFSHMPEIYLDLCLQLSLSVLSLSGLERSASGGHQTQHYMVLSRIK